MTQFSDNIYSGFLAATSAQASTSCVLLSQTYFASAGANVTVKFPGRFPPNTQNLNAAFYVTQAGAATANSNVNLWINGSAPNGQLVLGVSAIGSAQGRFAPTVYRASAAASPQPPSTGQTNGGEIPFKLIVSGVSTEAIQTHITFNRTDTT